MCTDKNGYVGWNSCGKEGDRVVSVSEEYVNRWHELPERRKPAALWQKTRET